MPVRKTILITGASSGIGAELARQFAAQGRDLALCARREDRLESLREEIARNHPGVHVVVARLDVTDEDDVRTVFADLRGKLGSLDRVVVNAGDGGGRPVGTGGADVNLRVLRTNVVGALAQCEAAMEIFREQQAGHLVVISSVASFRGMPRRATAYAASKAALSALAEGLRIELHGSPIRVSTIAPGYIRTEMTARVARAPFIAGLEPGVARIVRAIEREPATAVVPWWPWWPFSQAVRLLPRALVNRLM